MKKVLLLAVLLFSISLVVTPNNTFKGKDKRGKGFGVSKRGFDYKGHAKKTRKAFKKKGHNTSCYNF